MDDNFTSCFPLSSLTLTQYSCTHFAYFLHLCFYFLRHFSNFFSLFPIDFSLSFSELLLVVLERLCCHLITIVLFCLFDSVFDISIFDDGYVFQARQNHQSTSSSMLIMIDDDEEAVSFFLWSSGIVFSLFDADVSSFNPPNKWSIHTDINIRHHSEKMSKNIRVT